MSIVSTYTHLKAHIIYKYSYIYTASIPIHHRYIYAMCIIHVYSVYGLRVNVLPVAVFFSFSDSGTARFRTCNQPIHILCII